MRKLLFLLVLVVFWVTFFGGVNLCRESNAPGCGIGPCPQEDPQPAPPWVYWNGSSYLPHTPISVGVYLMPSVSEWHPDMPFHFDNAIGFWNNSLSTTVFTDLATDGAFTRAWFVRAGSQDEILLNFALASLGVQFLPSPTCGTTSTWATVYPAYRQDADGHEHYRYQKVCVRGASQPNAIDGYNPQGYHYFWLMFTHELGHVLSLFHPANGCVMLSGQSMKYPCATELEFINNHYGL